MNKDIYFKLMKETSDISDRIILDSIDKNLQGDLHDLVLELPKKRANSSKAKSRPAIFRFAYELAGGKDWKQYENVAASLEMLNLSTYVLNYVLDDKGGEKPKQQRNNECMTAMIQRELAQDFLRTAYDKISYDKFVDIDKRFSEINRFTSGIGQYLDGNRLRDQEENYLEIYIERCEGLTGKFMQNISEIGGILAGATCKQITALGEFGKNYGTLVQIINDLGDYLPETTKSVGKVYQDQYSDLRHGCLTFPAYYVLEHGSESDKEAVKKVKGNLNVSLDECNTVTKAFVRLGGVKEIKNLARHYAKKAKQALNEFDKCEARDFLSTALLIYRSNKYYDSLKNYTENKPFRSDLSSEL